jgi:hypothetical protein
MTSVLEMGVSCEVSLEGSSVLVVGQCAVRDWPVDEALYSVVQDVVIPAFMLQRK